MFRILLLGLLIGANWGYAATAAGGGSHAYASMLAAVDRQIGDGHDLILILGSNPDEVTGDRNRPFLYSDPLIYTLGNRPSTSGEYDATRHFNVDFNDEAHMRSLAETFKGKFKTIAFDLSVLKFFRTWTNLQYARELLRDDGAFYVPQPSHKNAVFPQTAMLPAEPGEEGGPRSEGFKKRLARSKIPFEAKALGEVKGDFASNQFTCKVVKENDLKNEQVKKIFARSAGREIMAVERGEVIIDVLVAVKSAALNAGTVSFSAFIGNLARYDEMPESAAAGSGGAASAADPFTPPYEEVTARRIVVVPNREGGVVKVLEVNTTPGKGYKEQRSYKIQRVSGGAYTLEGSFYGREDLLNKIVAAESLIQRRPLKIEDFIFDRTIPEKLFVSGLPTSYKFVINQRLRGPGAPKWAESPAGGAASSA